MTPRTKPRLVDSAELGVWVGFFAFVSAGLALAYMARRDLRGPYVWGLRWLPLLQGLWLAPAALWELRTGRRRFAGGLALSSLLGALLHFCTVGALLRQDWLPKP